MNNIYEYVKENILTQLEEGKENGFVPWSKPWIGSNRPFNYVSQKSYKGINLLLLPDKGEYLTFNQIKKIQQQKNKENIKLKKGSKASKIVFWKFDFDNDYNNKEKSKNKKEDITIIDSPINNISEDKKDEKKSESSNYPIVKYYNVFHISDVENLKSNTEQFETEHKRDKSAEEFLSALRGTIEFEELRGSDRACFIPMSNKVQIPSINQFEDIDEYYLTLFHELIHATGHETRLNRISSCDKMTDEYSKEELVAEIGANMLGTYFGIKIKPYSISYINSWANRIRNEKGNFIVNAAQQSEKAVNYLLDIYIPNRKEGGI